MGDRPPIAPVTLDGQHVRLVPLSQDHCQALIDAVQDGELWRLWYTGIPEPDAIAAEIDRRLASEKAGSMVPFTVIDQVSRRIVGMTTYCNIDHTNQRLEVGHTWYAAATQRTPLNTEAKLLLLSHAFETLGCIGVEFRTNFFNHQSRRAIERLGAKLDGILRQNGRAKDGSLRDTCVYSVIASEWPATCAHLRWQLAKPR